VAFFLFRKGKKATDPQDPGPSAEADKAE
jgi:hypothetical protein